MRSPTDIPKSNKPARSAAWLLLLLLLVLPTTGLLGQQRKQLEDKRKQLLREIELTSGMLEKTKQNKEAALDRFVTLQRQIRKRRQLVETLEAEVAFTTTGIEQANTVVEALKNDVVRLQEEYRGIAQAALRQRLNKNDLLFLFSADNFNEAFKRWQYLRQYDQYRNKQAKLILDTKAMLSEQIVWMEERKVEKETLLKSAQQQAALLDQELKDKDSLLKTLKGDESRLNAQLKEKQVAHQQLNDAIESIIREEMAKVRRDGRKPEDGGDNQAVEVEALFSADFEKNKGRLSWPVSNGVVTSYFGRQEHPTLAGVQITNNGIDIRTEIDAEVKAVFPGEVVGMQYIPGYAYMVILKHGKFYTVYSNLETVLVKRKDIVRARQPLGRVSTDPATNTAKVHFEIWQEKTRLNPLQWVAKK